MQDQLVEFETAKLSEERGFDIIKSDDKFYNFSGKLDYTFQGYPESLERYERTSAPTQSLLQKWLREKHKEHIKVVYMNETNTYSSSLTIRSMGWSNFKTYEEALEKGLQEALKLI